MISWLIVLMFHLLLLFESFNGKLLIVALFEIPKEIKSKEQTEAEARETEEAGKKAKMPTRAIDSDLKALRKVNLSNEISAIGLLNKQLRCVRKLSDIICVAMAK
jgi:hypothetical protein